MSLLDHGLRYLPVASIALLSVICFAQSEPDSADVFYRLDGDKLISLERQTAVIKGSSHGFMVVGIKAASEIKGRKSSVRFKAGAIDLVVRSAMPASIDLNTIYSLRKLTSKKNTRELIFSSGHASPLGSSVTTNMAEGAMPVEFSRYGQYSLKMSTANLPPGEYEVGRPFGPALFCFGID
jgi:hypothetical protein